MMTVLGIFLFLLNISLHELGHALAMQKHNIRMKKICLIGISGPKFFSFKIKRLFGDTPIVGRLIILGGMVQPTYYSSLRMERMPIAKYGEIMGAGISVNFLIAAFLFSCQSIVSHDLPSTVANIIIICAMLGLHNRFSFYIYPLIGLAAFGLLLHLLYDNPREFVHNQGSVVAIASDIHERSKSLQETLGYAAAISFGIGIANCLPFFPLDGGKIVMRYVEKLIGKKRKKLKEIILVVTAIPILILLILSVGGDLVRIVKMIF